MEHGDLEAAIVRAPELCEPRIVYADWLAQHGDPRGELAAVQAAIVEARGPGLAKLLVREAAILDQHAKALYGPLLRNARTRRTHLDWFIGFVAAIDGHGFKDAGSFLQHPSGRFLTRVDWVDFATPPPCLRRATIHAKSMEAAWRAPALEELTVLFDGRASIPTERHEALRKLVLASPAGDSWAAALTLEKLPSLNHLELRGLRSAEALRVSDVLRPLPQVRVMLGLAGDEGSFAALSPVAARVSELSLQVVGRSALESLSSLAFPEVGALSIPAAPPDQVDYFQRLPGLPSLRSLDISFPGNIVGYQRSLANSALARQIEELTVTIDVFGAGRALTQGHFERLQRLRLNLAQVSTDTLETRRILAVDAFPNLHTLSIAPVWHLAAVADSPLAARIQRLCIALRNDRDAPELLRHCEKFPNLRELVVGGDRTLSAKVLADVFATGLVVHWNRRVQPAPF